MHGEGRSMKWKDGSNCEREERKMTKIDDSGKRGKEKKNGEY